MAVEQIKGWRLRGAWPAKAEIRTAVFDYIECFYNRNRRHSSLGYLSPDEYERNNAKQERPNRPVSIKAGELQTSLTTGVAGRARRSGMG